MSYHIPEQIDRHEKGNYKKFLKRKAVKAYRRMVKSMDSGGRIKRLYHGYSS